MSTETTFDTTALDWDKVGGLMPVIVQDAATLRVLMLGYMDRAALDRTLRDGRVTFFSRSKQRLWTKGETSGHHLELVAIRADCDGDTLLVSAHPHGPTCHTGSNSCFGDAPGQFLGALDALVRQREHDRPLNSYTTKLFEKGTRHIAQKVRPAMTGPARRSGDGASTLPMPQSSATATARAIGWTNWPAGWTRPFAPKPAGPRIACSGWTSACSMAAGAIWSGAPRR